MLQKHLRATSLSTAGATFARFVYSAPIAAVVALIYATGTGQGAPTIGGSFWGFAIMGGVSQILGTMCVVALFAQRNFAVGISFKKTEVIMSVIIGFVILGDAISLWALVAILIGLPGVMLLSDPPQATGPWRARLFNRAAGLGLLSGFMFGFSGVGYRGASLSIASEDSFYRAIVTLALVTAFQMAIMAAWLAWRERGEILKVLASWRVSGLVGITSMIGSTCWFWAFTLQAAGLVNAVGQIEMALSLLVTLLVFKERITPREWQGLALLALSIGMLIAVT